ncbi:hypothetical protein [Lujinxingia litoralis]|nr:hypothetical protein [Lujinxingia litoralis]
MPLLRRRLIPLSVLLLCGLLASPAAAQNTPDELAQQYFDEGAGFFIEGNYARAILSFRRAYEQRPDPMILYNMSLAHSRLGNHREAYQTILATQRMEGLPDQARVRVDARVDALHVVVTAEALAPEMAEALARKAEADQHSEEARAALPAPPPLQHANAGMGLVGWAGVGTTVVGAGLLTGALLIDRGLSSDLEAYQQAADQGRLDDYRRLRSDIESRASTGRILLYSGAGAAVLGLGMWVFGVTAAEGPAEIDLAFSPDGSGMVRFSSTF